MLIMTHRLLSAALGVVLLTLTAVPLFAREAPAPGAVVRDARGEVLGRIETVVTDATGRPVQVLVRSRTTAGMRSELRALPASSLRPTRDGVSTPLRKSEFEVLPTRR
jgi:hypothetical protein